VLAGLSRVGCLVVLSRSFEGFGQIGPQAMGVGCPVVAYDAGGIREWCSAPFGTVVPVGDTEAMAVGVLRWLKRLGDGLSTRHWRREMETRWGENRFATEYLAALEAAL
jgi:glycosyltransferase involved in cell wall biosynthesis